MRYQPIHFNVICGPAGLMLMSSESWLMLCGLMRPPPLYKKCALVAELLIPAYTMWQVSLFSQGRGDVIPSVQSWSMALMMRSHSSARVRQPHSPSRGTYSSSFCSSSISGTLIPNSSGNVAARRERIGKIHQIVKKLHLWEDVV